MVSLGFLLLFITISSCTVDITYGSNGQQDNYDVPLPYKRKDFREDSRDNFPDASQVWNFMTSNGVSLRTIEQLMASGDKTERRADANSRSAIQFSDKRGILATLSEDRRTATRESNNTIYALVYTTRPLDDNELFEIRIVSKDNTSNANVMMFGVTAKNPEDYEEVPDSMMQINAPSWFLLLTGLFENNGTYVNPINNEYCPNIPKEGDRLGVLKKLNGDLHFYYNGDDLGVAKSGIKDAVYPVADIVSSCKTIEIY